MNELIVGAMLMVPPFITILALILNKLVSINKNLEEILSNQENDY